MEGMLNGVGTGIAILAILVGIVMIVIWELAKWLWSNIDFTWIGV